MSVSKANRFRVLVRDGFTCRYCGHRAPDARLEVDHRHPVSRGGTDRFDNLVTACYACNRGKRATLLPELSGDWSFTFAMLWVGDALTEMGDGTEREIDVTGLDRWLHWLKDVPPGLLLELLKQTREWVVSTPHPRKLASDYLRDAIAEYRYGGK